MDKLFFLGRLDPEMNRIAFHLKRLKIPYCTTERHGQPVSSSGAYRFNAFTLHGGTTKITLHTQVYFVECKPEVSLFIPMTGKLRFLTDDNRSGYNPTMDVHPIIVDHHNPEDPGYDIGYEHYFEGSSLGQVLVILDVRPGELDYMIAAADHCLSHAYSGHCFNVVPRNLRDFRYKRNPAGIATVTKKVDIGLKEIARCDYIEIGGHRIKDGRNLVLPYATDTVAQSDEPVIVTMPGANKSKFLFLSARNEEIIKSWLDGGAKEAGVFRPIGVPSRGVGYGICYPT